MATIVLNPFNKPTELKNSRAEFYLMGIDLAFKLSPSSTECITDYDKRYNTEIERGSKLKQNSHLNLRKHRAANVCWLDSNFKQGKRSVIWGKYDYPTALFYNGYFGIKLTMGFFGEAGCRWSSKQDCFCI
ncbi:hypothetical protein MAR_023957 [Mya arenaria]|uniref:Uncharacterized protein n=1 Tax=Mya arenaria TaxID=6604 RepID=A0ABY7DPG2_MYAAR|nr:hypothetical protein MAR_023957 [Mya arenaria]